MDTMDSRWTIKYCRQRIFRVWFKVGIKKCNLRKQRNAKETTLLPVVIIISFRSLIGPIKSRPSFTFFNSPFIDGGANWIPATKLEREGMTERLDFCSNLVYFWCVAAPLHSPMLGENKKMANNPHLYQFMSIRNKIWYRYEIPSPSCSLLI